jgi:hypothetical protein
MKRTSRYLFVIIPMLMAPLLFSACNWTGGLSVADYDTVVTAFVSGTNYADFPVYYLVTAIENLDNPDDPASVPNETEILQKIDQQMQANGYTPLVGAPDPDTNRPDIYVEVGVTQTDFFSCYSGWYPGWGYPGWGWYYPGGCYYSYSGGTLIIQFGDTKNATNQDSEITAIWHAGINGILNDTSSGLLDRVRAAIDQAFAQSPYLKIN